MFIQVCSLVYCKLILCLEKLKQILSIFLSSLFLLGRINVKRLFKWMKETLENSSGQDRAPPKGVIQMDLSLLHHLTKEAKHDLNMLLVPASKFITVSIYS